MPKGVDFTVKERIVVNVVSSSVHYPSGITGSISRKKGKFNMAIKISVPSKKAILRSYVLDNPALTILKEELDLVDEKFFGNVYTIKNGVRNPIKTHVSEVIQELENDGIGYKIKIPSRKGSAHEQLLFVKYAK